MRNLKSIKKIKTKYYVTTKEQNKTRKKIINSKIKKMLLNSVFKSLKPSLRLPIFAFSSQNQSGGGSKTWKDRDSAQEKDFFNKEDEKSMRKLLNKMRETTAKTDPANFEKETKKAHSELEDLFKRHGVQGNSALYTDLIKWKFQ